MIKSKKKTALVLALALVFSTTSGYAYGTSRDVGKNTHKIERKRPDKQEGSAKEVKKDLKLPTSYPDGEFFGKAEGYSGEIEVRVVVKQGKIVELQVVHQTETPGYYENGLKVVDSILKKGTLEVDTISGATITSQAILEATAKALGASVPQAKVKSTGTSKAKNSVKPKREEVAISTANLKDGRYQGSAQGYADTLTVEVEIRDGKILSAKYISGNDDEPYLSNAMRVLTNIVNRQTTQVDTVSGATYSSLGLINAASKALQKASGGTASNIGNASNESEAYKLQIKKLNEEIKTLKARAQVAPSKIDDGEGALKDGRYEGSAIGYNGEIVSEVVISGGKITEVHIKKHSDDKEYIDKMPPLLANIVKNQGTKGVDTISGATFSSKGILGGVSNALRLSRGQEMVSSGGDGIEQIKRLNEEIERLKKQLKSAGESTPDVTGKLKDGRYSAKASGYGGLVEVLITVREGKVSSVILGENNEDSQYISMANSVIEKIEKLGTTKGVDIASGATFTSNAILNATKTAMLKASGQEIKDDDQVALVSKDKLDKAENELDILKQKLNALNQSNAKTAEDKADGEYTGFGRGYANRLIKAIVTVNNKKITTIKLEHTEDRGQYFNEDREQTLIKSLIEKNGTSGVDTVSGATMSSSGVIQAVNDALKGGCGNTELLDSLNKTITQLKASLDGILKDRKDFLTETANLEGTITLADGVYTGYGRGWSKMRSGMTDKQLSEAGNPPPYNVLTSVVTIEGGRITHIETTEPSSRQSRIYLESAKEVHDKIIEANTIAEVDTISEATFRSRGMLEAVNMAMMKSHAVAQAKAGGMQSELEALLAENERLRAENDSLRHGTTP